MWNSKTTKGRLQQQQEPEARQGIAMPPNVSLSYSGSGGLWACENCGTQIHLSEGTKEWTCARCIRRMYTYPQGECPLEKMRRFVLSH